ncbi:AAA family ATPase [Micromonospora coerulea]|uniref:AAA family ATPase n=1 Tax=Micromonospora coerulea TaxID=47856 RepID=UPI00190600A8|nr:AAA family ATPase [Micromonospora veneta]
MTPAIDRVIDALRDATGLVRQSGGQWQARCPAHEDRNPSLSVRPIEGSVLVHCHAGCQLVDVLAALNMTPRDLYDEPRGNELARYQYTDATGQPTRTVHRLDGKQFKQSGDKKQCQLYRLPRVMEAATFGRTVYLVEGEKDVHAVESLGEVATTAPQGADNFAKVDVSPLKGARVVAVVDRDAAGEKWAAAVRARLDGYAAELHLVEAAAGKDAADHIAAGHPLDALVPVEAKPTGRRLVLTAAADIEPEPVVWAWQHEDDFTGGSGRIPLGSLSVAAGREGTGKSSFGIWLAAMITRGTLPGSLYGQPHAVIYAAVEDSWKYTLVPRLIAAGADLTKVFRVEVVEDEQDGTTLSLPVDNALLEREMRRVGAALLVLDPLMSTIGAGIDTHRERDVRVALDPLARLADRARCVVLGIAHFNKGGGTDPSSLITGSGAFKNVPRSVFGFAADPEGDRVMTQTKNSLGRLDLPSLSYQIEGVEIPTRLGPAHVGRLVWLGESDRSVTDILSDRGDAEDQEDRQDAAEWLRSYLADQGGEASAVDVFKAGDKDGFRKDALKRAKRKAGVISEKGGMDAGWMWRLKPTEEREGSEGSKGADGKDGAPFVLPSEPDTTKGAPKSAPPRELRSSLPSLPSLPSEPSTPHSWWVGSNRPEHPDCLACRAMRPGGAA